MSSARSNEIKAEARSLGFSVCGIARAEAVEAAEERRFDRWIEGGGGDALPYMERYRPTRLDPRLLLEGARSIIVVALNYTPARRMADEGLQLAAYAYGKDYHDVMRKMLGELAERCRLEHWRSCCDTAPMLERYWAEKAGVGWRGRNHQLIVPGVGSMVFLGEIVTDEELEPDKPIEGRCGTCHACTDACPTKAIGVDGGFCVERCLSYQLIENRGELSEEARQAMGNCIYGCDRCQTVCPHNRHAAPTSLPQLQPSDELMGMTTEQWQHLSIDDYRRLFKGSAVKRAKYEGLMRNVLASLKIKA